MNKYSLQFMTVILFLLPPSLPAQPKITIGGTVLDQETRKPLPYANIKVENTMRGTVSNLEGRFEITLDSSNYSIRFTYIGYENKILPISRTDKSVSIELAPKPINMKTVVIYPYSHTWEERYILRAIDKKKQFKKQLHYYTAQAYSKTSFSSPRNGELFALLEAVSDIAYQAPDLYREKVVSLEIPVYIKNIPYESICINQEIDLYNENTKVYAFSLVSPLNDHALDYYHYKTNRQFLSGQDTILQIDVRPKTSRRPLWEGELFFNKNTHQLVEARLNGGPSVKDELTDSLSLLVKYKTDSLFTLPAFTRFRLRMSFAGIGFHFTQEYSFINHSVNDSLNRPYVDVNQLVSVEPNLTYQIGLDRDAMFRMPLSVKEMEHRALVDSVFNHPPLHKRIFLFFFTDLYPLLLNQPATIGKIKISQLSNWYRFNKAEGHYLGIEHQFVNKPVLGIYASAGYSFTQEKTYTTLKSRYRGLEFETADRIVNLGGFDFNRTSATLSALLSHRDDIHYLHSTLYSLSQTVGLFHRFHARAIVSSEEQKPVTRITGTSLLMKDRTYGPNYPIRPHWNNRAGIELHYLENRDKVYSRTIVYRGNSFMNFFFGYYLQNQSALKSDEDRSVYHLRIHRYQPVISPVDLELKAIWHKQDRSKFLQESNFISRVKTVYENENDLDFYTLNDYEYLVKDYLKLQGNATLFHFPKILTLRISFGGTFSYLKPHGTVDIPTGCFNPMDREFWEYGLVIKGIPFLNLYLMSNNLNPGQVKLLLRMNY